ncbi:MAG: RsmD family RNA methyltransferase [Kiritimatiellae bacterium]|nr:RsmD family RNA methyltransferase [Kiritimatiellia bacterium]
MEESWAGDSFGRWVRCGRRRTRCARRFFSALGVAIVGARVLDLYAGTGSLGLESASRGAASVVWVESNPRAAAQLQKAVQELCPKAGRVVKSDATAFLGRIGISTAFDIVFADPPYAKGLQEKTLPLLMAGSIVAPSGLVVFEMGVEEVPFESPGWSPDMGSDVR